MLRSLALVGLLVGCGKTPQPTTTAFNDPRVLHDWFTKACGITRQAQTSLTDRSLPVEMDYIYSSSCGELLTNVVDTHIEIQGTPLRACAVRIGPARIRAGIDPSFVESWFEDKPMAARVKAAMAGLDPSGNYERLLMVDGVRIAIVQQLGVASKFHLIVDGCGRVPERSADSHF